MTTYVALLRAVNVGGTGKLPMSKLVEFCNSAGFSQARTYIASGNAIFSSKLSEREVRDALETRLRAYARKEAGVVVRSAVEIAKIVAHNPFADRPGNRVMVLFTDEPLPANPLEGAVGVEDEEMRRGIRELYVFYPKGGGVSRLRLPAQRRGTVRNMNTVARLAELAGALPMG